MAESPVLWAQDAVGSGEDPSKYLSWPFILPVVEGLLLLLLIAVLVNVYQRRLRQMDRRLTTLLHNLPGMANRCHNDGHDWVMEYVSAGVYTLTGYHPHELEGSDGLVYGDLILEEDADMVSKEVMNANQAGKHFQVEYRIRRKDGKIRWVWEQGIRVDRDPGEGMLEGFICDINERRELQEEKTLAIENLKRIMKELKHLKGIIPVCSACNKIRNDKGSWQLMEDYIRENTDADFSHGICPECAKKLYPEYYEEKGKKLLDS